MKKLLLLGLAPFLMAPACQDDPPHDSDSTQRAQQERILAEGSAVTGMPAIRHFRERKLLKDILELRDQASLTTYTYLVSDYAAKLIFFCHSVGYPLPYATQYTAPMKPMWDRGQYNGGNIALPQADPNGLFSPASAEGTWVMCQDPKDPTNVRPVYVEPRVVVSQFDLLGSGSAVERTDRAAK